MFLEMNFKFFGAGGGGGGFPNTGGGSAGTNSNHKDGRLFGEPGQTKREGYKETRIGSDGRATMERHHTDHNNTKKHSNPHDHDITWVWNAKKRRFTPKFGKPQNYPGGNPPPSNIGGVMMENNFKNLNNEAKIVYLETQEFDVNFSNAEDIVDHMERGCEVEFYYNNEFYFIGYTDGGPKHPKLSVCIYEGDENQDPTIYYNPIDALDHPFGDKTLVDILPDMKIQFRAF